MLYLVDTDVLLRLFDRSDPNHGAIRTALKLLRSHGHSLVTTPQNIAEFWNVSTRPSTARGGFGQSVAMTDQRVRFIERFGVVLAESAAAYSDWRNLVLSLNVTGASVHDARIAALMRISGVTHILTLNARDFQRYPKITATIPDEVLQT